MLGFVEMDGFLPGSGELAEVDDDGLRDLAIELRQQMQLEPAPTWKAGLKRRLLDAYDQQFKDNRA